MTRHFLSLLALTWSCSSFAVADAPPSRTTGVKLSATHTIQGLRATTVASLDEPKVVAIGGLVEMPFDEKERVEIHMFASDGLRPLSQTAIADQNGIGFLGSSMTRFLAASFVKASPPSPDPMIEKDKLKWANAVYEFQAGELSLVTRTKPDEALPVATQAVISDGKCFIGVLDGTSRLKLINLLDDRPPTLLETRWNGLAFSSAEISRQGTRVAIGRNSFVESGRFALDVWDVSGKKLRSVVLEDAGKINDVDFTPDGSSVATSASTGKVHIWKIDDASPFAEREFELPEYCRTGGAHKVRFSDDGSILAARSSRNYLVGWNVASGKLAFVIHEPYLIDFAWLADDRSIATISGAADESTVKIWRCNEVDE